MSQIRMHIKDSVHFVTNRKILGSGTAFYCHLKQNDNIVLRNILRQNRKRAIEGSACKPRNICYHFEGPGREIENAYHLLYDAWLTDSGYVPSDNPTFFVLDISAPDKFDRFVCDFCLPVTPL